MIVAWAPGRKAIPCGHAFAAEVKSWGIPAVDLAVRLRRNVG
jgi:hypothetical protein